MALIFIMFYGGFGTKWSEARPVAGKAVLLSSLGTVATAVLVGLFAWLVLKFPLLESFLLGSVISSTDAASVFSILAITSPAVMALDIYHIVFFIVLFSILIQGALLPVAARKLGMTDSESDVMKIFTDYTDEVPVQFLRCTLAPGHPWVGKAIRDLALPPECLMVLLTRGEEKLVPNGSTVLEPGDQLILSGRAGGETEGVHLYEKTLKKRDPWLHRALSDLDTGEKLIIMIRRVGDVIIPGGDTVLAEGDVLLINDMDGDPLT